MRGLQLLLLVTACSPPPAAPAPPPAPALEVPPSSASQPLTSRRFTVRASTRSDTVVRLFVSLDCSGPELRRDTAVELERGVEVESVHGKNVFSAVAVDPTGLPSPCSAPVTVEVRLPMRGSFSAPQVLRVSPPMPTRERTATLQGTTQQGWTVRVWGGRECQGPLLASTDAATFQRQGVEVPLPPNRKLEVTLDAELSATQTLCNGPVLLLENDEVPPLAPRGRFFPPPPWPNAEKAVVLEDLQDARFVSLSAGDTCTPSTLVPVRTFCGGGVCQTVVLPLIVGSATTWGLQLIDGAGNRSACTPISNDVDPRLEAPPVYLEALDAGISLNLLAISSVPGPIEFHAIPGCPGTGVVPTSLAANLAVLTEQLRQRWFASVGRDAGTCAAAP
ncbi:MAG: hypothetical protein JNJ54_23685 [Myxococcaceae bacterium]|nr:hypothetical protein [Myxococcaceae bacterium]